MQWKEVVFVDTSKQEFDVIMMATGYKTFDFFFELLTQKLVHDQYKHIFKKGDPILVFIEFVCPVLGTVPVLLAEIQPGYVANIYSGEIQLKFK